MLVVLCVVRCICSALVRVLTLAAYAAWLACVDGLASSCMFVPWGISCPTLSIPLHAKQSRLFEITQVLKFERGWNTCIFAAVTPQAQLGRRFIKSAPRMEQAMGWTSVCAGLPQEPPETMLHVQGALHLQPAP